MPTMIRRRGILAVQGFRYGLLLLALLVPSGAAGQAIDPTVYLEHVKLLASDEYEGRGNGTPALDRAAEYIAEQFRAAGLEPGGDDETYFQAFELTTGLTVGSPNTLTIETPTGAETLRLGPQYRPLSTVPPDEPGAAGQPALSVPLVFAGYGISAPDLDYDDYDGLDVAGKAVLVLRHEPQETDADSPFEGRTHSSHATFLQKARIARRQGAVAMVIVDDPQHDGDAGFDEWLRDPQAEDYGIPVLQATRNLVQAVLGDRVALTEVAAAIDEDLRPRSRTLPGVTIRYTEHLTRTRRTVRNVVGVLPGAGPLSREAVVVGAHYDHLGRSGRFSLAEDALGQIHNGADDNASGTAAVIEIAKAAAATRERFSRTLVFVTFAGEEIGLLGSRHYLETPVVPVSDTVAMINLDMVGRPNGRVLVGGFENAPDLEPVVEAAQTGLAVTAEQMGRGSAGGGASDHASFVAERIPSIFLFSGLHADYHRPSDDWEKIDAEGGAAVARLAYELAARLSARQDRIAFVAPQADPHANATVSTGGGYGPYFGSVPDFAQEEDGVRFADIRDGSPAGQAGLVAGDVLVEFDGTPIRTLYDFTFALQEKQPGDVVAVVVLRDGQTVRATVELTNRP